MDIKAEYQKVQADLQRVQAELQTASGDLKDYTVKVEDWKSETNARVAAAEQFIVDKADSGFHSQGATAEKPAFSVKVGQEVFPALRNDQKLAAYSTRPLDGEEFSLGDYVKAGLGMIRPTAALTSNSGLVPTYTSSNIIDDVRAASTIVQAGALTVPIDGPTNLCRIDGDAIVYQHTEGAEDISDSQPTFSPVLLEPKALVASVPISAELVADSENLDQALQMSLAQAFAAKLDSLAVLKILADTDINSSGTSQDPATWAGVLAAIGSALGLDQQMPKAHISSHADFIARAGQTDTGGAWLNRPEALKDMLELFTTKIDAGTAIFGDFTGIGIALRQDLRLELIRFQSSSTYSHLLVAHARAEGYVLQPKKLFLQDAIASS